MKRVKLLWHGPYSVVDLSEILKQSVFSSDKKYPTLNNYGFYMYFDHYSPLPLKYIGQAFGNKPRPLRERIRWEITKDGLGCALSKFSADCKKFGVDKSSLILKVAHIEDALDNGSKIEHSPKLMNDVEKALIFKMQPVMNTTGKKRYRRGSIEILNNGDFTPLDEKIVL